MNGYNRGRKYAGFFFCIFGAKQSPLTQLLKPHSNIYYTQKSPDLYDKMCFN